MQDGRAITLAFRELSYIGLVTLGQHYHVIARLPTCTMFCTTKVMQEST